MERMNELARSCNCACDKHERSQAAGPCMHGGKHAHSRHSSPAGHQLRLRTCLFIAASIKLVDRPSEDAHYSISNSARLFVLLMVVEQSKQPLRCCLHAGAVPPRATLPTHGAGRRPGPPASCGSRASGGSCSFWTAGWRAGDWYGSPTPRTPPSLSHTNQSNSLAPCNLDRVTS